MGKSDMENIVTAKEFGSLLRFLKQTTYGLWP